MPSSDLSSCEPTANPPLHLLPLSLKTAPDARRVGRTIFPQSSEHSAIYREIDTYLGGPPYAEDPDGIEPSQTAFYLARSNLGYVGLTGHYQYFAPPGEVWLGWFGLIPEVRGQGWGKVLLSLTLDILRTKNAHTLRLWTTDHPADSVARHLYRSTGFAEAPFSPDFPRYFVYSLALTDSPLVAWCDSRHKPHCPAGLPRPS